MIHDRFEELNSLSEFVQLGYGIHGYKHSRRVCQNGLVLARLNGADQTVVGLFAWLHDACRKNDDYDPEHGARAAKLAESLQSRAYQLDDSQMDKLTWALELHDRGHTDFDITIGTCWDADRLDLPRIGISPDPLLMSTVIGRQMAKLRYENGYRQ